MTGGRDRRPTTEPVDGVYELDLEGESAEEVLRAAAEAAERSGGSAQRATREAEQSSSGQAEEAAGELDTMREKYLRALADFDNYRKRAERDRAETSRAAIAEPLRGFLSVVDNLDRALRSGGSLDDLRSGVEMILRQSTDLLRRFGVEEIEAQGQAFDPAVHEAVIRYEDPAVDEQTVSEEFQKGYRYQGRLLRPAMVKVAVPKEGGDPAPDQTGGAANPGR